MGLRAIKKRNQILEIAEKVFLEKGYERASMSEITSELGGSKSTIYSYFASKEDLFFEVISKRTEMKLQEAYDTLTEETGNIRTILNRFGNKFLSFLYSPEVISNRRLIISEAKRINLGRLVYERRILPNREKIARYLQGAMDEKKLRQTDPVVTAMHLISLLESELIENLLYQLSDEIDTKKIVGVTERAVDAFLAGYSNKSK